MIIELQDDRLPKWARRAFYEEGRIFLPAAMSGNEKVVFLALGHDGEPCIQDSGHIYADAEWMIREEREANIKEQLIRIRDSVLATIARDLTEV